MKHQLPTFTKWSAALLAAAVAVGCNGSDTLQSDMDKAASSAEADLTLLSAGFEGEHMALKRSIDGDYRPDQPSDGRKIIRTGDITVEVDAYDTARERLEAILAALGGYVADAEVRHEQNEVSSATLVLRIPADRLGEAMRALGELGAVRAESLHAQDVSDQYYDLEARLRNARALEKRLIELVADATGSVSDLLAVEQELARVREQIELYQGQLERLANQTTLATLTAYLVTEQTFEPVAAPTFGQRASNTFDESIDALEQSAASFVLFFVAALPWVLPFGLFAWIARRRYLRGRREHIARVAGS